MTVARLALLGTVLAAAATTCWADAYVSDVACSPSSTTGAPVTCGGMLVNGDLYDVSMEEICLFDAAGVRSTCCHTDRTSGPFSCEIGGFVGPGIWTAEVRVWSYYWGALTTVVTDVTVEVLLDADQDGDGFGPGTGDCDDLDPSVFPGAPELCDGRSNDCLDPDWPATSPDERDVDGDGQSVCAGDCNDEDPLTYTGAAELCDTFDNDCNGEIDEPAGCLKACAAPDLVRQPSIGFGGEYQALTRRAGWNGETFELLRYSYVPASEEDLTDRHAIHVDANGEFVDSVLVWESLWEHGLGDPGLSVWTGSRWIRLWQDQSDPDDSDVRFLGAYLGEFSDYHTAWSGTGLSVVWLQHDRAYFTHTGRRDEARILGYGTPTGVQPTGDGFVVFRETGNGVAALALDRGGRPSGPDVALPVTPDVWTGDRFLGAWFDSGAIRFGAWGPAAGY